MVVDKPDTAATADAQTQPAATLPDEETSQDDDDSVYLVEDLPPVDRKRKFDEVDEESNDVEEVSVVSPAKVLKVCEDSDVKTASVEAPVDGEVSQGAEARSEVDLTTESKLSLPLSSETNIEDDYVVITPDDVPPVDSDEVLDTVAKMVPSLSSAASAGCSNETLDTAAIPDVLLHREYVANPAISAASADASRCFTLGSYNILADYHAQKDYGHGMAPWLTAEQLSLSYRHQRLMEELVYLDEDIICLQEVGGDYMHDLLEPSLLR